MAAGILWANWPAKAWGNFSVKKRVEDFTPKKKLKASLLRKLTQMFFRALIHLCLTENGLTVQSHLALAIFQSGSLQSGLIFCSPDSHVRITLKRFPALPQAFGPPQSFCWEWIAWDFHLFVFAPRIVTLSSPWGSKFGDTVGLPRDSPLRQFQLRESAFLLRKIWEFPCGLNGFRLAKFSAHLVEEG